MSEKETITKEKLASHLRDQMGLSALVCEEIVHIMFDEILSQTSNSDKITLTNFGKFFLNHKKARPGFTFKTGKQVSVKPRTVMRYIPARSFKDRLQPDE